MSYLKGIDLSKWQAATPSLAGFDFVIARASIGTSMDARYAQHIAKARAAGLVTGAYHFNWDDETKVSGQPAEQARYFVDHAGDVDLLFLDVEGDHSFEPTESAAFIAEVHRLGKKCGLYMSASTFRRVGQDYDWIAKWGTDAPFGWEFWQYTSSGHVAGYDGRLDLNYFNGTLAQLRALSNRKDDTAMKAITTTTPKLIDWPDGTPYYDVDGTTRTGMASASAGRFSPFGCGTQRAFYKGDKQLALVTPSKVYDLPAPADTTPFTQADVDAARLAATDQMEAEVAALKLQAASATDNATTAEKARIRTLLGLD